MHAGVYPLKGITIMHHMVLMVVLLVVKVNKVKIYTLEYHLELLLLKWYQR